MRFARFAAATVALSILASCGLLATSVKDIQDDPRAYDGKTVTVSGTVKDPTNLLVVKFFTLEDSTGGIVVITERPLPKAGERLTVRGVVHEAFSIGDKSTLVIKESGGASK